MVILVVGFNVTVDIFLSACRYLCGDSRGGIQCYCRYISLCLFAGICVVILVVGFNVTVDIFLSACL